MNAAVLCPGPSLAGWPDDRLRSHSITVGVNRAVHRIPCSHWVFADEVPYAIERRPAIVPHIFTSEHVTQICRDLHWEVPIRLTTFESLFDRFPQNIDTGTPGGVVCWASFSATAALIVAAAVGATRISLYGADWTDEPDWDGVNLPTNKRDASRWGDELPVHHACVRHLTLKGIEVIRHLPQEAFA